MGSKSPDDRRPATPSEVFYVVQTTAGAVGYRRHRLRSPLYQTRQQAQIRLMRLQMASPGCRSYSVWSSTTYVEPAQWLYEVVMSRGS